MYSGLRDLRVIDDALGLTFPAVVQYPTHTAASGVQIGPYHFDAERDAPVADGRFPLVLISHGGGGSHLLYRSIATHLAQHGYIVVAPEHPSDNRNDKSMMGTEENMARRPRHAAMTLSAVIDDAQLGPHVDASAIAVIGHSYGGYTALAMAGGQPWSMARQPVTVQADARVKAAVLMAAAAAPYQPPDALQAVRIPLLVLSGDQDPVTPLWQAELVRDRVPDPAQVTLQVVNGAGHFAFITPFPAAMRSESFAPSTDPPGFDREQFHRELPQTIHAFLQRALAD